MLLKLIILTLWNVSERHGYFVSLDAESVECIIGSSFKIPISEKNVVFSNLYAKVRHKYKSNFVAIRGYSDTKCTVLV